MANYLRALCDFGTDVALIAKKVRRQLTDKIEKGQFAARPLSK